MHTPLAQLACALLTTLLLGCATPRVDRDEVSSNAPAIVIRQYPDYPAAGHGSVFPGGLIAALWSDGRMVRATGSNTVGKFYVEGSVSSAERDAFFAFLSGSPAVRAPEGGGFPVDGAGQYITVRRDGRASTWVRLLPDAQSAWREVELRLLSLSLQGSHAVDWETLRKSRWYD